MSAWYGNGHLKTTTSVTPEQRRVALDLLGEGGAHNRAPLIHVLASTPNRLALHDGFVPCPSQLLKKYARRADLRSLVEAGLLEVRPEVRPKGTQPGLCREFRLAPAWTEAYVCAAPLRPGEHPEPRVDLVTGKAVRIPHGSVLNDASGHPYSNLVRGTLTTIVRAPCNVDKVIVHLNSMGDLAKDARGERERRQFLNDRSCMTNGILPRGPVRDGDGIGWFAPRYIVGTTGRVYQEFGGAMSCSRAMKAAVYTGVVGLRNFDLRASQAVVLSDEFRRYGIDCPWLASYVEMPNAKTVVAAETGLSVGAWKSVFYAAIFGSALVGRGCFEGSEGRVFTSEIARLIYRDVGEEGYKASVTAVRAVMGEFMGARKQWYRHLVAEDAAVRVGRRLPLNPAGLPIRADWSSDGERARRLAAHRLQGRESAAIHTLTGISSQFGFVVLANEHDGVVTLGEIPAEAMDRVRAEVGIDGLLLEEKPFV